MNANLFRKLLLPLLAAAFFCSCTSEHEAEAPGRKSNEVTFSMRIPGIESQTRALTETEEYTVTTLDVIVFENGGGLLSRATHVGIPKTSIIDGKRYADFVVKLEEKTGVTSYDFYLVANARDIITTALYTGGNLRTGMTKDEVQAALKLRVNAGAAWDTHSNKTLPMWGRLIAQPIEANKIYPRTTLTRMLAKIDLSVALTNVSDNFEIEEVYLYNYQKQGYVIPKSGTAYFDDKAKAPSIESGWAVEATPIDYSAAIKSNAVTHSIYVFEAAQGSPASSEYMKNICLVVGGAFNGTKGFYRLDFANMDASTLTPSYMAILRNHNYSVAITAINGPGLGTKEEAYNSKPMNVATEIAKWEDGEFIEGEWNGNYSIKFTSKNAHFDMFGNPAPQQIKILTNAPDFKFTGFSNRVGAVGRDDSEWSESPSGSGKWSNGHFNVVISSGQSSGEYKEYILHVKASPTKKDGAYTDPFRESVITITGKNMSGSLTITQENHNPYFLGVKSVLDITATHFIRLPETVVRVPFEVTSTHPYDIELSSTTMLSGVYLSEHGNDKVSVLTDLVHDKIWVDVTAWNNANPRVANITFRHNKTTAPESDAGNTVFTLIQHGPYIEAAFKTGNKYTAEIRETGGSATIVVSSNLSGWTAVVGKKVGNGAVQDDLTEPLSFFQPAATGSGSAEVTFTLGNNTGTEDVVYYIKFRDTSGGSTETDDNITVTHKAKVLGTGGTGATPPVRGVRAEVGILSVNSKGQLNLDGQGWIVYFKWGSTIAIAGGEYGDTFEKTDIAWVPEIYTGTFGNNAVWNDVPNAFDLIDAFPSGNTADQLRKGIGDPCKLAVKNGLVGRYRMPTGNPYENFTQSQFIQDRNGTPAWKALDGQYYPLAGGRYPNVDGKVGDVGNFGGYWTSTSSYGWKSYLTLQPAGCNDATHAMDIAYPVRCVPR